MSINGYGYGTPFLKVFTSDGVEVSFEVIKFTYKYSEKTADECTIIFKSVDNKLPDNPLLQDNQKLKVTWGYLQGASKTRTVYIYDSDPKMDDKGVELTLICHDKLSGVGDVNDNVVHKNASIADVANTVAGQYGLTVELEDTKQNSSFKDQYEASVALNNDVNNPYGAPVLPGPSSSGYTKFLKDKGYKQENITITTSNGKQVTQRGIVPLFTVTPPTKYPSIPQANKSHKQLLNELAHKEPGGPYIVTGRDDKLIIRKRDLNQAPFRSYDYANEDGNLIDFNPEVKNKHKHKGSAKTTVVGFDRDNKQAFSDDRSAVNDPTGVKKLGSTIDMPSDTGGKTIISPNGDSSVLLQTINNEAPNKSLVSKQGGISYSMARDHTATVVNIGNIFLPQHVIVGTPENLANAQAQGSNDRQDQELKRNPGKAKVLGNPLLEDNMVITFMVESEKFSGNYYVEECTHEINEGEAYYTTMDILRTGTNSVKGKPTNKKSVQVEGKVNNKTKGPTASTTKYKNWVDLEAQTKLASQDKLSQSYTIKNINGTNFVVPNANVSFDKNGNIVTK